MGKKRILLWTASPLRALVETWLLGALFLLGAIWQWQRFVPGTMPQAVVFLTALVSLWHALRVRLPDGAWTRIMTREVVTISLHFLVSLTWLLMIYLLGEWSTLDNILGGAWLYALLVAPGGTVGLAVFRVGIQLWSYWQELRQRRLLWEMTYIQVQLVMILALFPATAFAVAIFFASGDFGLDLMVRTLFPALGVIATMMTALLFGVLPPAAVIAYIFARRTTGRLDELTRAAAILRGGDLSARSAVTGKDEVAQLQQDFNAMAAALERTMGDLEAERDKVADLLAMQRELTATVSHELRTPIATVQGTLESGRARWDALPKEVSRDLALVEGEVHRLQRLIDDLFTLSQAELGALSLHIEAVDSALVLQQVAETQAPMAWQRERVEILAEVAAGLPAVSADEDRLIQILTNLVRNGVRHTPPGGIVALMAELEGDRVKIDVRDTGEGISADEISQIWERFYRGESSQERTGDSGAGLGLALVRELVQAMGGSVSVHSKAGQGSCFTVYLPLAEGDRSTDS